MRPTAPTTRRHDDPATEQIRREHHDKIVELQQQPAAGIGIVAGVTLVDTVTTAVPHKLGRVPIFVVPSIVRGATATGRIVESRSAATDRTKYVLLTATGHGATITLDLLFM